MSNTNTGGPAFPQSDRVTAAISIADSQGMTLRDYFAAKALQGLMPSTMEWPEEAIAEAAYRQAEAMLKARDV